MKILVLGYYGSDKNNLGDNLFQQAFQNLFPKFHFTFTDHITTDHLVDKDAIWFGGGSFLDQEPAITKEALDALKYFQIFYIGVGAETDIHLTHQQLIKQAKLVAIRSPHLEKIKEFNKNTIIIPDLVYSLTGVRANEYEEKSIIFLPNATLIPKWSDPHWMHISWEYWKMEIAQVIDTLIDDGFKVDFYPMCSGKNCNDKWAADEILNATKTNRRNVLSQCEGIILNSALLSKYSLVITQRYHGAIIAEIAGVPYISISHHDKLNNTYYNNGSFIPYFEVSKKKVLDEIKKSFIQKKITIDRHLFRELLLEVNKWFDGSDTKKVV